MSDRSSIVVERVAPRSIAGISAFRNSAPALAALATVFALPVPTTPRFVRSGETTLSCLAPGRYVANAARDANLPARLASALSGVAAITDQSDLWQTFTVSGPDVRELLTKIVPIDLDPAKFTVGALALTRASHLDVRLWCVAETCYEMAVARSCEADLLRALGEGKESVLF